MPGVLQVCQHAVLEYLLNSVLGHEITATIAQMYLHPSVLPQVCALAYPYTP